MGTVATETLTVRLPKDIVARLSLAASRRGRLPDDVVTEILSASLPPIARSIVPRVRREVERLGKKTHDEIEAAACAHLAPSDQGRLSELLSRNREGTLTREEDEEIEALFDKIEDTVLEFTAARLLLSRREPVKKAP